MALLAIKQPNGTIEYKFDNELTETDKEILPFEPSVIHSVYVWMQEFPYLDSILSLDDMDELLTIEATATRHNKGFQDAIRKQ